VVVYRDKGSVDQQSFAEEVCWGSGFLDSSFYSLGFCIPHYSFYCALYVLPKIEADVGVKLCYGPNR
jgi:hypothetical protein